MNDRDVVSKDIFNKFLLINLRKQKPVKLIASNFI